MPTIDVHPPSATRTAPASSLPELLQTPLGLAILELQGTINFPQPDHSEGSVSVNVGRLVFPDYDASISGQEGKWMKKVWLYVGHQRMTGEVKKLAKPLGVLRRLPSSQSASETSNSTTAGTQVDELEIAEIIKWKIVFSSRPEPVGLSET
ncbi:MAG: hypothetical protein MMC23_007529 [Stictis urceolatum]|nr:hypothetical protein [Stictis urceolata]